MITITALELTDSFRFTSLLFLLSSLTIHLDWSWRIILILLQLSSIRLDNLWPIFSKILRSSFKLPWLVLLTLLKLDYHHLFLIFHLHYIFKFNLSFQLLRQCCLSLERQKLIFWNLINIPYFIFMKQEEQSIVFSNATSSCFL